MSRLLLIAFAGFFAAGSANACGPETRCQIGNRHYRVFVPDGLQKPAGALVFAHGFRGTDTATIGNERLRSLAQERNLVLIATKSRDVDWALPFSPRDYETEGHEEEAYYESVVRDAQTEFGFEAESVFMAGFSSGGMVTWHMACHRPDLFAGFVPMSGTFWLKPPASCASPLKPLVHIHGTEDKVVPLAGRQIQNTHQGDVVEALELYARQGGFAPVRQMPVDDLACQESRDAGDRPLMFCTFTGGHRFSLSHLNFALDQMIFP